jgi:hypothetical protein
MKYNPSILRYHIKPKQEFVMPYEGGTPPKYYGQSFRYNQRKARKKARQTQNF